MRKPVQQAALVRHVIVVVGSPGAVVLVTCIVEMRFALGGVRRLVRLRGRRQHGGERHCARHEHAQRAPYATREPGQPGAVWQGHAGAA